ncbi:hypothetical protein BH23ACT12_BH23ACT12_15250 [soil metagenome]
MQYGVFEDSEFQPVGLIRVDTENSIWFVGADRYQRLPREEHPRPQRFSIEGRLADTRWHGLRRCWWRVHADGDRQLRLLPDVGPPAAVGIVSGDIVGVKGRWMPAATATGVDQ